MDPMGITLLKSKNVDVFWEKIWICFCDGCFLELLLSFLFKKILKLSGSDIIFPTSLNYHVLFSIRFSQFHRASSNFLFFIIKTECIVL